MRKQSQALESLEKRMRLQNLYFALQLDLLGKTREERMRFAFKYQAQAGQPKKQWLCN